ncbi:RNA-directed DNA polymerase [Vibrio vulnificus]
MKQLLDLTHEEAKQHFLRDSSYFNGDLPSYISFAPLLEKVDKELNGRPFLQFRQGINPADCEGVNYSLITNKDGRLSWRPYELIHPLIYVGLVDVICEKKHWEFIVKRFTEFSEGLVECCSLPVISTDDNKDQAAQVKKWWQAVEQKSLTYSLEFNNVLHTDVTDCYGSLYTHSVVWALHGLKEAKEKKRDKKLLGNIIDFHLQSSRYGQTNGIPQGSALMDLVAEMVLGYVDELINNELAESSDVKVLRYRDDYRIFTNSNDRSEEVLKINSDKLRTVGMKLGVSKTFHSSNVISGSIKPDKLAGIELQTLRTSNAKSIQKQLLRLHSFGLKYPNSGALRRLVSEFHSTVVKQKESPDDLEVQVAIATDIAFVSPATFPAVAGILSHLISLAENDSKSKLWAKVRAKMSRIPYNGYLEVWLQRVIKPKSVAIDFESIEPLCNLVEGNEHPLWNSEWIASKKILKALETKSIIVADATEIDEVVQPEEVELFTQNAMLY